MLRETLHKRKIIYVIRNRLYLDLANHVDARFRVEIVFILGFGAKSVVELFEDSVDIGEELRYGKPATVSLVWIQRKYTVTVPYRAVFRIRKFLGLQDPDP
jgi:hypothetical protein